MAFRKEKIKDQMVTTAARVWGVQESEIEGNFDPLIMLIIEACAAEMEKIGNEITESHTRLIDYLAEILIPGSLFGSVPASGIIQANPLDGKTDINVQSAFYLTQKIQRVASNTTETVDLYLSPVGKFKLLKADLLYYLSGNKLFRVKENNSRQTVHSIEPANNSNQLWLAINADKTLDSLDGLHIYFDLRGHSSANNFYNSLAHAKALINDESIQVTQGYGDQAKSGIDPKEILLAGDDRTNKINRKVCFLYENHFLHIDSGTIKKLQPGIPPALQGSIPDDVAKQMQGENLVFIKIELPQYFSQEVFDSISASINAFPVVNKKLTALNYRTDAWLNIIPIPVNGIFFDLASVKSEKGDPYKIRPSAGVDSLVAGEAIVRASGVGKTSSREVREMINNITETIRDQSAYFGQISNEFILDKLREIGKILAGLEDNMRAAKDKKEEFHYLMLRPKRNGEMVSVDYWITNGADANVIKAGMALNAGSQTAVNTKKCFTLTGFSGGKNGVTESEKKIVLRQQINSGGKIVSAEDVKLQCMMLFGDKLRSVEVQKTVQVSSKPGEGFTRTIDVNLQLSNKVNDLMKPEIDNLCRELEFILQANASPVYPFRVNVVI